MSVEAQPPAPEKAPLTPEQLRRKEAHRRSMLAIGGLWVAAGLAAAYLAATSGRLPAALFGRWSARSAPPSRPALRRVLPSLVPWQPFSREALFRARAQGRPVLLSVWAFWSRPCRVMDEQVYARPDAARLVAEKAAPVRVDADERPDLARRYLSGGWPTTALLVPSGQVLDAGTFMSADGLSAWLTELSDGYAARRERVQAAAGAALEDLSARLSPPARFAAPADALAQARRELEEDFDGATGGFGPAAGPRFPRFDRVSWLASLPSRPWAQALAERAAAGSLRLQDPVWGAFFRYADGPGWSGPETEVRLKDQADAVAALGSLQPKAAARAVGFVDRFLADPAGGYYSSLSPDVEVSPSEVMEGRAYYAKSESARRKVGLPRVDRRVFFASSARMAAAVLAAPPAVAGPAARAQALRTARRLWESGVTKGQAWRELPWSAQNGLPLAGLLDDQLAGIDLFTAAFQSGAGPQWRARAKAMAEATERELMDEKSGALLDRPVQGELPAELDRAAFPDLEFAAWRTYGRLAAALPLDDPWRARLRARRAALAGWLWGRASRLDAAQRALLAQEAAP